VFLRCHVMSCALFLLTLGGIANAQPVPTKVWTDGASAKALDPQTPVALNTFSTLASELSPSVVSITTKRASPGASHPLYNLFRGPNSAPGEHLGSGLGTGFIIHTEGYALTNHHVIEGAQDIQVSLQNGSRYEAEVVGSWKPLDVALVKFTPKEKLVAAALGDSDNLAIGEWVVAIGNALGLNHTVTAGIVSAKGRREVQPGREPMMANFIQTDASINPGNSGGPLISTRGEVVGINTAINAAGQGIGFAVPINMVKTILPQLASGGVKRAYLGVRVGPVDRALAQSMGLTPKSGAMIVEVLPGLPAAKAGMKAGDIVTEFDGQPIKHWEDLPWLASTGTTSKSTRLEVLRRGKAQEIRATLTHYPQAQRVSGAAQPSANGRFDKSVEALGLRLGQLSREQRRTLRLKRGQGVVVDAVEPRANAYRAGIRQGDVILQLNYEDVGSSPKALAKKLSRLAPGETLSLLIRREGRQIFMSFPR